MSELLHMRVKAICDIAREFYTQASDGADADSPPSPQVPLLMRALGITLMKEIKGGNTPPNLGEIAQHFHFATGNLQSAQLVLKRDFANPPPGVLENLEAALPVVLAAQRVIKEERELQVFGRALA